jgi:hypothetical protein
MHDCRCRGVVVFGAHGGGGRGYGEWWYWGEGQQSEDDLGTPAKGGIPRTATYSGSGPLLSRPEREGPDLMYCCCDSRKGSSLIRSAPFLLEFEVVLLC